MIYTKGYKKISPPRRSLGRSSDESSRGSETIHRAPRSATATKRLIVGFIQNHFTVESIDSYLEKDHVLR